MKKIYVSTLFILILCMALHVHAQIDINNIPKIGKTYNHAGIYATTAASTGAKGQNAAWDFSKYISEATGSIKYFDPSSTQYAASFPTSTIGEDDGNQKVFYKFDNSSGVLLGSIDTMTIKLNPPLLFVKFPGNFGDTYSATSSAVEVIANPYANLKALADSIRITVTIVKHDTIDGKGTIATPFASYDALRIITHIKTVYNIEARYTFTGTYVPFKSSSNYARVYTWWTKNVGKEVMKISFPDSVGNKANEISWYTGEENTSMSVSSLLPDDTSVITPNPNNGTFSISLKENMLPVCNALLLNSGGKEVFSNTITNSNSFVDLDELPDGQYYMQLSNSKGAGVVVKKIIIKR